MQPFDALAGYVEALLTRYPVSASFNTYLFLGLFLPVVLAGYWALTSRRWRLAWLTLASAVFFSLYDWRFMFILYAVAVVDFLIALRMDREGTSPRDRKTLLAASVTFNLALLAFFKYAVFAAQGASGLLALLGLPALPGFSIVLPVGISFFTFKTMSYTIDVYRREVAATRSLLKYSAFVSLFPELVAGPIVRYRSMDEQMDAIPRRLPDGFLVAGISLFALGLAKKVLVADTLAPDVDALWANQHLALVAAEEGRFVALGAAQAWAATIGYTMQLYFDFSGYSDMAIGLALLLGFRFPINFRAPYQATDPSDFWTRWHITLSSFLRDYLYIPLGGNRGTGAQTARNLLLVMLLGGLWHGAAWTFVAWGLYHGLLLAAHRAARRPWDNLPRVTRVGATFLLVALGWVLFRAPDLPTAASMYASLAGLHGWQAGPALPGLFLATVATATLATWTLRPTSERRFTASLPWGAAMGLLLAWCVVFMGTTESPFLYYQF